MARHRLSLLICGGLALSGCAWLPAAGPTVGSVVDGATKDGKQRYAIVEVDDMVLEKLRLRPPPVFESLFGPDRMPPSPTISVGDAIVVSVWEAGGASLFASSSSVAGMETGSRQITIPEQTVLPDGAISIPFAGRVAVVGKTVEQLQQGIRASLNGKAIDPQIIVSVTKSAANTASVTGQAVTGGRVPLSPKGDRILDLIAAAGGVKTPVYDTYVRLTRGAATATLPLSVLLNSPRENIYVWPGDILTVVNQAQHFVTFGAAGRNAEVPFDEETINLSQALGKSAGLLDDRADATGVFLLRYEPQAIAGTLGLSTGGLSATGDVVPVVYRFDLNDIKSYFLAQRFAVQDKDIIYVANARANGIQKFFGLVGTLTSPIVSGAVLDNSLH